MATIGRRIRLARDRVRSLLGDLFVARRRASRYAFAYRRLRAALEGAAPEDLGTRILTELSPADELTAIRAARRAGSKETLLDSLESGDDLGVAVAKAVRQGLAGQGYGRARGMSQSLQRHPNTHVAGCIGEAIACASAGLDKLAWANFREVPPEDLVRACPAEYALAAARAEPDLLDDFADAVIAAELAGAKGVGVLAGLVAGGRVEAAHRLTESLAGRVEPDSTEARDFAWLAGWVDALRADAVPSLLAERTVALAIGGYNSPDRAASSPNIGDYIQSLAACAMVARRTGVRYEGDEDLAALLVDLAERVPPGRRVEGAECTVHLVGVNKEASHHQALPADTWFVATGGFGHTPFELGQTFPLNPNLNPIFVSFHLNRLDGLTAEAIDYLRAHTPIGCRDWNTVHLLLSADIPAFFAGSATTVLDVLFGSVAADASKPVAFVDVDPEGDGVALTHIDDAIRERSLAQNLRDAVSRIDSYQRDYSRVVTSRLFCHLPAWAAGVDVEFRAPKRAGVQYHGIVGSSERGLAAMQTRIAGVLDAAVAAILAGAPREDVYAAWAAACAPEVARARARHAEVTPLEPLPFDVDRAVKEVLARSSHSPATAGQRSGEPVHVAIALDGNLKHEAQVVATGLADNTARPVHLYVLCRDHTAADIAAFNAAFTDIDVTWLPCGGVDYGELSGLLGHTTVATMDRLLLPYLLPDVEKVVYHDIDALTVADIGDLYDTDLADAPLAAAAAGTRHGVGGFRTMWAAASAMPDDRANDYLRRCAQVQHPDFTSFNAGVMVLSLARLRDDDFAATMLPWASMYGLNDQQVLNCYAGNSHLELDPRWNARPAQEPVVDPYLIHWAGQRKPWNPQYVTHKDSWLAAEQRLAERTANAAS